MLYRLVYYALSILVVVAAATPLHSMLGDRYAAIRGAAAADSVLAAHYYIGVPETVDWLWVLGGKAYVFSRNMGLGLGDAVALTWFGSPLLSIERHGSGVFVAAFDNGSIAVLDAGLNVVWRRDTGMDSPWIRVVGDTVYTVSGSYEHEVLPGKPYMKVYTIEGELLRVFTGEAVSKGTNKLGLAEQFFIEALKTVSGYSVTIYSIGGEKIYSVNSTSDSVEMRVSAVAGTADRVAAVLTRYDPLREVTVIRIILYSEAGGVIDDSLEIEGEYSGSGYIALSGNGDTTTYTYLVLYSGRALAIHGYIDGGGIHVDYMGKVPAPTSTPSIKGGMIAYAAGDTLVVLGDVVETYSLTSSFGSDTLIHFFNETKILLYNPVTRVAAVAEIGVGEVYAERNVEEITAVRGPYIAIHRGGVYVVGEASLAPVPGLEYVAAVDEDPETGAVYVARTRQSGTLVLEKRAGGAVEKETVLAQKWDSAYIYAGPGPGYVTVAVRSGDWINLYILDSVSLEKKVTRRILADGAPLFLENKYLYAVVSYFVNIQPLYWKSYIPGTDTVAAAAGDTLYVARWKNILYTINYTGDMELRGNAIYVQWFRSSAAYLSPDSTIYVLGRGSGETISVKNAKPVFARTSVGALYGNGTLVLYNVSSRRYIRVRDVADAYAVPGIDEVLIVTNSGAIGVIVGGAVTWGKTSPPLPAAAEYTASHTPYLRLEGLFYRVTGVSRGVVEAADTLVAPIRVGIESNATALRPLWVVLAAYSVASDNLVPTETMIRVKIYRVDGSVLEEIYSEASVINISLPPGTLAVGAEPPGGPLLIYPLTGLTYAATPLAEPALSISIKGFNYTHILLRHVPGAQYRYIYTGVEAGYRYTNILYYGGFDVQRLYANVAAELWATGLEKPLNVELEPREAQGIQVSAFYSADPVLTILPVNGSGTVSIEAWSMLSITGGVEITYMDLLGTGLNTTIHVAVGASATGSIRKHFTYNATAEPSAEIYVFASSGKQYYAVILRGVPASPDDSRIEEIKADGVIIEPGTPLSVKEGSAASPLTVNDTEIPVYAKIADIGLLYTGEFPENTSTAEVTYSYSGALPYRATLVAPVKNLGNVSSPTSTLLELLNSEGAAGESGASTAQGEGGASGTAPGAGEEPSSMGNTGSAGPGEAGGQPPYLLLALAVIATLVLVTAYMWRHRR